MVLVDTSVWVSHFKTTEPRLKALLNDDQVLGHPFVIGELACGNLRPRREILSLLQVLPSASVVSQGELLHFVEQKRLAGTGVGFIDVHLLASCQLAGIPLWTLDSRLQRAAAKLNLSY